MKIEKEIFPAGTDSRFLREVTKLFTIQLEKIWRIFTLGSNFFSEGLVREGVAVVNSGFFCMVVLLPLPQVT